MEGSFNFFACNSDLKKRIGDHLADEVDPVAAALSPIHRSTTSAIAEL